VKNEIKFRKVPIWVSHPTSEALAIKEELSKFKKVLDMRVKY
jgi:hypothetical protein